jgi:predicted O-methyltransferase YrrM
VIHITNNLVTEYINKYYKPLNDDLGLLREYAEDKNIPIILKETEEFLLQLLRWRKPKRILEIGTSIGYSSACFSLLSPASRILTIENKRDVFDQAVENLDDLGVSDRVHVLFGDAEEVMTSLLHKTNIQGLDYFDFIFIDAAKSHYRRFWDQAIKLVQNEGMIICDNTLMNGRTVSDKYDHLKKHRTNISQMRDFLDYITDLEGVTTTVLPIGDGISMSVVTR